MIALDTTLKRTLWLLATFILAAVNCLAEDNPLLGTWEILSSTGTRRDQSEWIWQPAKVGGSSIKIFSSTHFAVVTNGPGGKFSNASAGPYALKHDTFTESLQNSSELQNVGTVWLHHFAVSGDLLTNTYVNPVTGARVKEIWRRVHRP